MDVAGALRDFIIGLLTMLNDWWHGIIGWLSTQAIALINTALASCPSGWQTSIETVRQWLEICNAWFPLDYCFQLWIAYWVFAFAWWVMSVVASFFGVKVST